jgi:hypothetical protein
VSEPDDVASLANLVQQRDVRLDHLRPAGQEDAGRGVGADAGHQVLPEVLGEEGHHRGDSADALDKRVPEHSERSLVPVPEAPAGAADIPVRQVVDERLEAFDEPVRELVFERVRRLGDVSLRPRHEPTVEHA